MKVTNFIDIPPRMNELWEWIIALDSWDYCDPELLSELLLKEKVIPEEFIPAISDIILGKRKPNKKAAAKQKIPARERMKIAGSLSTIAGLISVFKYDAIYDVGIGSIGIGDRQRREPSDVLRELENEQRSAIEEASNDLGVSIETIENLLRAMRDKIDKFPIV